MMPLYAYSKCTNDMRQLFLDVGHSVKFPGACAVVKEHERNTIVADFFKHFAEKIGWKIVEVPRMFASDTLGSSNLNLVNRIRWINKRCKDGDWVLSIHANGSSLQWPRGVTTCYMGGSAYMEKMAHSLSDRIAGATGMPLYGGGAFNDRNGKFGRIGMVRDTIPPALLVEAGFVSNGADMAVPTADIARAMADWFEDLNGKWFKDPKI